MIDLKISWEEVAQIKEQLGTLNQNLQTIIELMSPPRASVIRFYTRKDGRTERVKDMFLKVTQSLPLSLKITDKHGNVAAVDGAPQWSLTDSTLATLDVSTDGMSAVVHPTGVIGVMKVQVSVDADLGEEVKPILGEIEIEMITGEAEVVAIVAGEPV